MDYFKEENDLTKKLFDLEEILEFQFKNDVQIIRGEDYQYICYINSEGWGTGLTTLGSLVLGIKQYKNKNMAKVIKLTKQKGMYQKGAKGYLKVKDGKMYFRPIDSDDDIIEIFKNDFKNH